MRPPGQPVVEEGLVVNFFCSEVLYPVFFLLCPARLESLVLIADGTRRGPSR